MDNPEDVEAAEERFPIVRQRAQPPSTAMTRVVGAGWSLLRSRPASVAASAGILGTWAIGEWLRARHAGNRGDTQPKPMSHVEITFITINVISGEQDRSPQQ